MKLSTQSVSPKPFPKTSAKPRVLLAIPCYNEEGSIGSLLREIQSIGRYDTVVVDDASRDQTYKIASSLSPCVRLAANLGIGGAVQTAYKYAKENNYDLCMQVDGDGQHPPTEVDQLVRSYVESPANIIIGSRFLAEGDFRSTPMRRIGIFLIRWTLRVLFGKDITDPTSGLRLIDRKAIDVFSQEYPHDFPEPISLAVALEKGLTVREVPILMKSREFGQSSISGFKKVAYIIRVLGYIILVRMGRHL
jgi:glycosyltransferase involved in cell wall biosynthesis